MRADRSLIANAVEESLRLEPAAARVDRYATADTELAGASIRRGDLVIVSLTAANRDPATFPDPDRFDLSRPNSRSHLAFAQGPARLRRASTWPGWRPSRRSTPCWMGGRASGLDAGATPPSGVVFRKPRSLPVRWD